MGFKKQTGTLGRRQLKRLLKRADISDSQLRITAKKLGVKPDQLNDIVGKAHTAIGNVKAGSMDKVPDSVTLSVDDLKKMHAQAAATGEASPAVADCKDEVPAEDCKD